MTLAARIKRRFGHTPPAQGGYDRVHDGLVSGWLHCPACDAVPAGRILELDGQPVDATPYVSPRNDVPQGDGFMFRFPPTGKVAVSVRVRCALHNHHLDLRAVQPDWARQALGALETSTWPLVTGWLAFLDHDSDSSIELRIDGYPPIPVRATLIRRDVEAYLGAVGVGGFQIDLGTALHDGSGQALGIALHDGTSMELAHGGHVLDISMISDSPLGSEEFSCLARVGSAVAGPPDNCPPLNRFLKAEVDVSGDWRELIARLGFEAHSAVTEQNAEYLIHHGCSQPQAAAWLATHESQHLASYAVSTLPASLARVMTSDTRAVPELVLRWHDRVVGLTPGFLDSPLTPQKSAKAGRVAGVVVAGLVHHRSGLGQNARNSLRALEFARIHGCPAPFFPARGSWNPRLAATREGISSLENHAVLLHLPIDRVIPSLSAQPVLLRTDRLIGYFMWETEIIPQQFRRALDVVDEIWTATTFVADSMRAVTDTPVHVTGHVVDTTNAQEIDRAALGIAGDSFVVHYAFDANSTVARKNPNGAIDAFHTAFGGDPEAVFLLKVRNMQQVDALARAGDPEARGLLRRLDEHPWIRLIAGEYDHAYALGILGMSDCYLSLHRSEGYGYGIAEAMALGTPVIATNYSGSTDLASERTAHLIPYEYTDVLPGEYFYWQPGMRWASPDHETAAAALRLVREGTAPDTIAARRQVERIASLPAVSARYRSILGCPALEAPR